MVNKVVRFLIVSLYLNSGKINSIYLEEKIIIPVHSMEQPTWRRPIAFTWMYFLILQVFEVFLLNSHVRIGI